MKISRGAQVAEYAIMRQPGHADGAISLNLGYGRKLVGRVGKGVGLQREHPAERRFVLRE